MKKIKTNSTIKVIVDSTNILMFSNWTVKLESLGKRLIMNTLTILLIGVVSCNDHNTLDQSSSSREILPPPDPIYQSKIEMALKDSKADYPERLKAPEGAPNVLLIMGDDIGFGHVSAFGGPAYTPIFDQLAEQGLIYTNFHTTAICAASRAALITGRNGHSVGMGVIPESSAGFPGYSTSIPRSASTIFETLRHNGYGTAWIGKTHLTPIHEITPVGPFDRWPNGMGAEYSYGFFGPGVSQWYPPIWENTTPIRPPKTPEQGYPLKRFTLS